MTRSDQTGVYDLPDAPDLDDLLRVFGRNLRLEIRTHQPATVTSYNPLTQRAGVTVDALVVVTVTDAAQRDFLATKPGVDISTDGREATLPAVRLSGVPVAFPRSSRGWVIFPLQAGDTGLLHTSDRSLGAWLQRGEPVDPKMAKLHALEDAVFTPGLAYDGNPIPQGANPNATVIEGDAIQLGRTATLGVARLTDPIKLDAGVLAALETALAAANATPGTYAPGSLTTQIGLLTQDGAITGASTKVSSG